MADGRPVVYRHGHKSTMNFSIFVTFIILYNKAKSEFRFKLRKFKMADNRHLENLYIGIFRLLMECDTSISH